MNAKKVKAIRQLLRRANQDFRDAQYDRPLEPRMFKSQGTVRLTRSCGRSRYKMLKESNRT